MNKIKLTKRQFLKSLLLAGVMPTVLSGRELPAPEIPGFKIYAPDIFELQQVASYHILSMDNDPLIGQIEMYYDEARHKELINAFGKKGNLTFKIDFLGDGQTVFEGYITALSITHEAGLPPMIHMELNLMDTPTIYNGVR